MEEELRVMGKVVITSGARTAVGAFYRRIKNGSSRGISGNSH